MLHRLVLVNKMNLINMPIHIFKSSNSDTLTNLFLVHNSHDDSSKSLLINILYSNVNQDTIIKLYLQDRSGGCMILVLEKG